MILWILMYIDENILDLVEIFDIFLCKYSNWLNWFFKNFNDLLKKIINRFLVDLLNSFLIKMVFFFMFLYFNNLYIKNSLRDL